MHKLFYKSLLLLSFCLYGLLSKAQFTTPQMLSSSKADTWVATDALGRTLVTGQRGSGIRKDKYVGIFYFVWQGAHGFDKHGGTTGIK